MNFSKPRSSGGNGQINGPTATDGSADLHGSVRPKFVQSLHEKMHAIHRRGAACQGNKQRGQWLVARRKRGLTGESKERKRRDYGPKGNYAEEPGAQIFG